MKNRIRITLTLGSPMECRIEPGNPANQAWGPSPMQTVLAELKRLGITGMIRGKIRF